MFDELLADYENPEDLLGKDGIFKDLKKRLLERALGAELTHHLGYEKGDRSGCPGSNTRNGGSKKKVKGEDGEMEISVPRDRGSSFEPGIIRKGQSRFEVFDDKIISMYARVGPSVRFKATSKRCTKSASRLT